MGSNRRGGNIRLFCIPGNKAQAQQAQLNRNFQADMSGTAHQREVEDLRAAGLNPILSGTGGHGASTPGGATAQQQSILPDAAGTALAIKKQKQEITNMKATKKLTDWTSRRTQLEGYNTALTHNLIDQQAGRASAEADIARRNLGMTNADARVRAAQERGDMDEANLWSSPAYSAKRKADAALETARKLIPMTSPGGRPIKGGYRRNRYK